MSAPGSVSVAILSDIHYAAAAERARGNDYEWRGIANPFLRAAVRFYRHFFWMRQPLAQAPQLDRFLRQVGAVDYVVANGDYSCDSAFIGVSDAAAAQSVEECLGKIRAQFGDRARFVLGDHELGKLTLVGAGGGMRLASWRCATEQLGVQPFPATGHWKVAFDRGGFPVAGPAREPAGHAARRVAPMAAPA